MMTSKIIYLGFLTVLSVLVIGLAVRYSADETQKFITWESSALDSQASVWLVNRFILNTGEVEIRPQGVIVRSGTSFGFDGADFSRTADSSNFATLVREFEVADPVVQQLAKIVNSIEISPWQRVPDEATQWVEFEFRRVQEALSDSPTVECYNSFFQQAYSYLQDGTGRQDQDLVNSVLNDENCVTSRESVSGSSPRRQPGEYGVPYILKQISQGRKVIFLDVRESSEYEESHIAGALNIRLRDLNDEVAMQLKDSDLVIAYCIKDFRGFEVAKALVDYGLWPVGTMDPHGLAGWRSLGLPLTEPEGLNEKAAVDALLGCARGTSRCQ